MKRPGPVEFSEGASRLRANDDKTASEVDRGVESIALDLQSDSETDFDRSKGFGNRLRRLFSSPSRRRRDLAFGISFLFHLCLAAILASIVFSSRVGSFGVFTTGGFAPEEGELDFVDVEGDSSDSEASFSVDLPTNDSDLFSPEIAESPQNARPNANDADIVSELGSGAFSASDELNSAESGTGTDALTRPLGGISRRAERKRGAHGRKGDVTKESEDAVERGLQWLARHQLPDGGWAFDLTFKDEMGRSSQCLGCSNSTGTSGGGNYRQRLFPNRTSATAIALLPFLGAGYTHTDANDYQRTIAAGLHFLEYRAVTNEYGVDFRDGFVGDGAAYVQALAVLVCCEAYEMTKDPNLRPLAEGGLRFIALSQLNDGGWRYFSIGDPSFHATVAGDTSVLGWQIMALKSGASAGFQVPASVWYQANSFLDLVMEKSGRTYSYQPDSKEEDSKKWGTTAAGTLSREYLGWKPGDAALDVGVKQLAKWIDSIDENVWRNVRRGDRRGMVGNRSLNYFRDGRMVYNLYFAYYASLTLHHYGGNLWERSFEIVRDLLVATQARDSFMTNSCESGSWLFYDQYMNDGGRLLNTSLAILILETPYRYLPMYRDGE